jgi:hypothetical protein
VTTNLLREAHLPQLICFIPLAWATPWADILMDRLKVPSPGFGHG